MSAPDNCSRTGIGAGDLSRLFKGQNRTLVPEALEVVHGLEDYWPLSLRQVFYQCVAALLVPNTHAYYRRLKRKQPENIVRVARPGESLAQGKARVLLGPDLGAAATN